MAEFDQLDRAIDDRGLFEASELAARLDKIARGHERSLKMAEWIRKNRARGRIDEKGGDRAVKLENCATWLMFRRYLQGNKLRLAGMSNCHQYKLCPVCAACRAVRSVRRYQEKILEVERTVQPYARSMLVLTMKNEPDLLEMLDRFENAWQIMRQRRKDHRRGRGYTEFSRIHGAVGNIEMKRGSGSGYWHAHMHLLIFHEWIELPALVAEWANYIGQDQVNVQLDVIKPKDAQDLQSQLFEVLKYNVSFKDVTVADQWEIHRLTYGKRLLRSIGCIRGVKVDPEEIEFDDSDLGAAVDLYFRWEGHCFRSRSQAKASRVGPGWGSRPNPA